MFLSETKLKDWEMKNIKKKVRMESMMAFSCAGEGRKRKEVALLWRKGVDVEIMSCSQNHIDAVIEYYWG